jgi:hypothetical protein
VTRKKKAAAQAPTAPPSTSTPDEAAASSRGPELLRRFLLGLVTALIVARPFVLGEDPGLLAPESEPSSMVLTFLWFVALAGWAIWRFWAKKPALYVGLVELGLFIVVACYFTSTAFAASYKHPAWLIAWEWTALLVVFFVVRQLAAGEAEQNALLAAFLATVVTISLYALYQYTIEYPALPAQIEAMKKEGVDPAYLAQREARILEQPHVNSTFAHSNSFAGYLVLLLPALAVAALLARQSFGPGGRTGFAVVCVVVGLAALWLTHSRGGLFALGLVALGAAVWVGRNWLRSHALAALGVLLVLAVGAGLVIHQRWLDTAVGKSEGGLGVRLDYWTTTVAMMRGHEWLGLGPGNYGRHYPQFMKPEWHEHIKDPHNLLFEVWSSAGPFAVLGLCLALGAFFWSLRRRNQPPAEAKGDERGVRWEIYLGGMAGLLLGFILRTAFQSPDDILQGGIHARSPDTILYEGIVAGVRAVVWFAVFSLLEPIRWPPELRVGALTAGVVALLLNLCVSGGIGFPSVAQPLWIAAALALAACYPAPALRARWPRLTLALPIPLLLGVMFAYFAYVLMPVQQSYSLAWQAMVAARIYLEDPRLEPSQRRVRNRQKWLEDRIIAPLLEAALENPADAHRRSQLTRWYGEKWRYDAGTPRAKETSLNALGVVKGKTGPQRLDPYGTEGFLAQYRLHLVFAERTPSKESALEQKRHAADALSKVIELDPTSAAWRALYAEALSGAGRPESEVREQAREALRLHELARKPQRRLNEEQLEAIVTVDPTSALARFHYAEALLNAKPSENSDVASVVGQSGSLSNPGQAAWMAQRLIKIRPERARTQAREALRLHESSREPQRQLNETQLEKIHKWLAPAS